MSIPQKHFQVGYALYMGNQPISACHNDDQRRGWLAANRAEAECATAGYGDWSGF